MIDDRSDRGLEAPTIDAPGATGEVWGDRFEVGSLIARGGMGEVYEGRDRVTGETVALKRLAPGSASDPALRDRFRREAEALARLHHPHVVAVRGVGDAFFAMERLPGRTLAAALRERDRYAHPEVVSIGRQLLAALAHVHAAGLVHRDVKPGNLMVRDDGHVTLLDFGLVRAEESHLTATASMVGTPDFMAPEQARDPRTADARSDLYAAGATLFAAWTGQSPYRGASSFEVMRQHQDAPVPSVRAHRLDLPSGVDGFLRRAMAKDADARFSDATEMVDALDALEQSRGPIRPTFLGLALLTVGGLLAVVSAQDVTAPAPRDVAPASSDAGATPADAEPVARPPVSATATPTLSSPPPPSVPPSSPAPASSTRRAAPIAPKQAVLRIVVLDRGLSTYAEVRLDDGPPRYAPVARWEVAPGPHTLHVSRAGFASKTIELTLEAGARRVVRVPLDVLPTAP